MFNNYLSKIDVVSSEIITNCKFSSIYYVNRSSCFTKQYFFIKNQSNRLYQKTSELNIGRDEMSIKLHKSISKDISVSITWIINKSLDLGLFQDQLKW